MCFLKFIALLLISSHISGGCRPIIKVSGGKNVCTGQDFTLTCQLECTGPLSHVKLVKEMHVLNTSNSNISVHIYSANKNHSGTYSCQTENGSRSRVYVTVKDCSFSSTYTPEYLSTVNTTSSSLTNTTHQGHTPSRVLEPVLICYMLFKTGVFLITSITAALITVLQKH